MTHLGTPVRPRIVFSIDCDTGVYEPSLGKVALSVNGVQATMYGFVAYCVERRLLRPTEAVLFEKWIDSLPHGVLVEPEIVTLPWPRPDSVYATDGPSEYVEIRLSGYAEMSVEPVNVIGVDTGRPRFKVQCHTCVILVHEATTSATVVVNRHFRDAHGLFEPLEHAADEP